MSNPNVPNAAFMAAAEVSAVDDDTIDSILVAGAPEIIAADRYAFGRLLRRQKFGDIKRHFAGQVEPVGAEFREGAEWALRAIASWCDERAAEARGGQS
jgi:hypothetical protein